MLSEIISDETRTQFETLKNSLQPKAESYLMALKAQEDSARTFYIGAPRHLVNLFGKSHAMLTLTPKTIDNVPLNTLSTTQPGVVFELDLANIGHTSLETQQWTSHGTRFNTGIFSPRIAFPPICIACLSESVSYKLVEVSVVKGSFGGKWTVDTDQDTSNRIAQAALNDRYWITLPFCKTHIHQLKGLDLSANRSNITMAFGNLQYAALFQFLNPINRGTYKSENCRRGENKSNLILGVSILALLVGLLFSIEFAVKATGFSWPEVIGFGILAVFGVFGIVYGIRIKKQFESPEPLIVD